ncbi:MAG: DeoR family transcriptional regulator [Fibromonadales bacterium]|nr:DeoR family transcriptional regulator [Fibromonadales bacterium]
MRKKYYICYLMLSNGKKSDEILTPKVSVLELQQETFEFFKKKGLCCKRLDEKCLYDSPEQLLKNLNLIDNGNLKQAALLFFHNEPENFITGTYIKVGFFHSKGDLQFQDEIRGNLFEQVERTMELLLTKYTPCEWPEAALREALLNAVTHKDYAGCTPIQIRVYPDKIKIWNEGRLPENWTIQNLLQEHSSRPYNPDIANMFFRSGYAESWGRGISKIIELCVQAGLPAPDFKIENSDFLVTFKKNIYHKEDLSGKGLNERQVEALVNFQSKGEVTTSEYMKLYNVAERTARNDLRDLVEKKYLKKQNDNKLSKYIF